MREITRPPEINRDVRGHDFYPKPEDGIPPLYSQDGKGMNATVYVHYFAPYVDIYVTEYDAASGEAFGWVCLEGDLPNAELGYVDLPAYESITPESGPAPVVERDQFFERKPLRECIEATRRRLEG